MNSMNARRDALRILFILVKCCESYESSNFPDYAGIFKGEAKLHACDFWMRYPDYLADELMNRFEQEESSADLAIVRDILVNNEPDLRRIPMIRYRFGAYEKIDNSISTLSSRGLVRIERVVQGKSIKETDFLINTKAFDLIDSVSSEWPVLQWYVKRVNIVASLVEGRGGTSLKDQQYEQMEYGNTILGSVIPCIKDRVRSRYEQLSGEVL